MCIVVVSQGLLGILVSSLACFPCCSLTLSLSLSPFFLSDILLFARLLGCPSAVVINTLPVAAVWIVVWRSWQNQAVVCLGILVRLCQMPLWYSVTYWWCGEQHPPPQHSHTALSSLQSETWWGSRQEGFHPTPGCVSSAHLQRLSHQWGTVGFPGRRAQGLKENFIISVNSIGVYSSDLSLRLRKTQKTIHALLKVFLVDLVYSPRNKKKWICCRLVEISACQDQLRISEIKKSVLDAASIPWSG